jgi:signal transduction histidine kinase
VPVPVTVDVGEAARERVVAWHPVAEGHLEQVLDNLIANALEALSAGHRVTVTTKATNSGALVIVAAPRA